MPIVDSRVFRPVLTNATGVASAMNELRQKAGSTAEMWRLLTERFVVDLDAVATLLPTEEPETRWLPARS